MNKRQRTSRCSATTTVTSSTTAATDLPVLPRDLVRYMAGKFMDRETLKLARLCCRAWAEWLLDPLMDRTWVNETISSMILSVPKTTEKFQFLYDHAVNVRVQLHLFDVFGAPLQRNDQRGDDQPPTRSQLYRRVRRLDMTSTLSLKGVIPPNLEELYLRTQYEEQLPPLPSSLRYLDVGSEYPHDLRNPGLPDGLQHLALTCNYRHSLSDGVLPDTLETLEIRGSYCLDPPRVLPSCFKTLLVHPSVAIDWMALKGWDEACKRHGARIASNEGWEQRLMERTGRSLSVPGVEMLDTTIAFFLRVPGDQDDDDAEVEN